MTPGSRRRDLKGVVSLEFLIAFPPLWVFCLCVFQLVLLARADLMVRNAAASAARSASVVLPDDPGHYSGEPEMSVSGDATSAATAPTLTSRVRAPTSKFLELNRFLEAISLEGLSRREVIETAARVPLSTLRSAPMRRKTVESALGPHVVVTDLPSSLAGLSIRFPDAEGDVLRGPEVTVRVSFAYPCEVPVARHLVCRSVPSTAGAGSRVWRFEHAATLLIHDAPYVYRTPRES